jgi:hypothetical protein
MPVNGPTELSFRRSEAQWKVLPFHFRFTRRLLSEGSGLQSLRENPVSSELSPEGTAEASQDVSPGFAGLSEVDSCWFWRFPPSCPAKLSTYAAQKEVLLIAGLNRCGPRSQQNASVDASPDGFVVHKQ